MGKGGSLIETDTIAAKSGRISQCATGKDRNVSVKPHGDCAALMNGSPCSTISLVEMRIAGAKAAEPTAYRVGGSIGGSVLSRHPTPTPFDCQHIYLLGRIVQRPSSDVQQLAYLLAALVQSFCSVSLSPTACWPAFKHLSAAIAV